MFRFVTTLAQRPVLIVQHLWLTAERIEIYVLYCTTAKPNCIIASIRFKIISSESLFIGQYYGHYIFPTFLHTPHIQYKHATVIVSIRTDVVCALKRKRWP